MTKHAVFFVNSHLPDQSAYIGRFSFAKFLHVDSSWAIDHVTLIEFLPCLFFTDSFESNSLNSKSPS